MDKSYFRLSILAFGIPLMAGIASLESCTKKFDTAQNLSPLTAPTGINQGFASLIANTPPVATAMLNHPNGTVVDVSGTVYVADFANHSIRMITPAGIVTTLAGNGTKGFRDGPGNSAEFNFPTGITVDRAKNVYVADMGNQRIRKITRTGQVTTLAGDGTAGSNNGPGNVAQFNGPAGITIDGNRNLYVADEFNRLIRRITPEGVVTTWAGNGTFGYIDATGIAAAFENPEFIVSDSPGNLYITDGLHNTIRKIDRHTVVTTIAGTGIAGIVDGPATSAQFHLPTGIAVDQNGANIYISDEFNQRIRKITSTGNVTTLSGFGNGLSLGGYADGPAPIANFQNPTGLSVDAFGYVYVADYENNRIRKINPAGTVSTLAGTGTAGFADGFGIAVHFHSPSDIARDVSGNIYVSDQNNNRIIKITPAGSVSTLAGNGFQGFSDGPGWFATFDTPRGIVTDSTGNVYVADGVNNRIRKITPAGDVTTFAGNGNFDYADGPGASASFRFPAGLAIDRAANIYVADELNNRIRKITAAGNVSTLAGNNMEGFADGTGTAASFNLPHGIAVDASGNVYVGDRNNFRVRKITASGVVTTLAGSSLPGFVDGPGAIARFEGLQGIAADGSGNVFVGDNLNNAIRKITAGGQVTTMAGNGTEGFIDAAGTAARFAGPSGVMVDNLGNIYVADFKNNRIRRITASGVVSTFAGDGIAGF